MGDLLGLHTCYRAGSIPAPGAMIIECPQCGKKLKYEFTKIEDKNDSRLATFEFQICNCMFTVFKPIDVKGFYGTSNQSQSQSSPDVAEL